MRKDCRISMSGTAPRSISITNSRLEKIFPGSAGRLDQVGKSEASSLYPAVCHSQLRIPETVPAIRPAAPISRTGRILCRASVTIRRRVFLKAVRLARRQFPQALALEHRNCGLIHAHLCRRSWALLGTLDATL